MLGIEQNPNPNPKHNLNMYVHDFESANRHEIARGVLQAECDSQSSDETRTIENTFSHKGLDASFKPETRPSSPTAR